VDQSGILMLLTERMPDERPQNSRDCVPVGYLARWDRHLIDDPRDSVSDRDRDRFSDQDLPVVSKLKHRNVSLRAAHAVRIVHAQILNRW